MFVWPPWLLPTQQPLAVRLPQGSPILILSNQKDTLDIFEIPLSLKAQSLATGSRPQWVPPTERAPGAGERKPAAAGRPKFCSGPVGGRLL